MGFARILKDCAGKPSGYRECDGEVAYLPQQQSYERIFRKVKIDLDTVEVLNHDFLKDRQRVYRRGVLLRGITPEGFRILNPAYLGNHQVIYTPYGDARVAHPGAFEVLDDGMGPFGPEGYGRDTEFVYFFTCSTDTSYAVRLRACKNPGAFTLLSDGYTKDDRHVYHAQAVVKKADVQSFTVLGDGYARDDRHIFWRERFLPCRAQAFRIWGDGYAGDGRQAFYNGALLDADGAAFTPLGDSYASDGVRVFGQGRPLDAAPQSFTLLGDGYAGDGQTVFWGSRTLDADRASFRVLGGGYAEDRDRCFFRGLPKDKP